MDFNKYDYVEPKGVNGKILITSFPGLDENGICLLYTSPSPRDATLSRMQSSA